MHRNEAVGIFGTHWTFSIAANRGVRHQSIAAKALAGDCLRQRRGILMQHLGPRPDDDHKVAASREEARLMLARELLRQARENRLSVEDIETRLSTHRILKFVSEAIVRAVKGRTSVRKDVLLECQAVREHLDQVISYESPERLAEELGSVLEMEEHPLEENLALPSKIYGPSGYDIIVYQAVIPLYLAEAAGFAIHRCKIARAAISERWRNSDQEPRRFRISYLIEPLEENGRNLRHSLDHEELDDLLSGKNKRHKFSLMGHFLFANAEDAHAYICKVRKKAMADLGNKIISS